MNRGTWRYRRDAFVSVTKRAILREAIIMLIIYPAEIFIESMRETLTRAGREIRENHESRITRVSFAFFSHFLPSFPRFYNKILFFFLPIYRNNNFERKILFQLPISSWVNSLSRVEFFESLVKFPTKAGRQKSWGVIMGEPF